ncbi:MAG: hypothetical protein AAGK32_15945, partial [Actinomycetota bacterium]
MPTDLTPAPAVLLEGVLGAPGDLDGRGLVLAAAALGETGVAAVAAGREARLWFARGRPVFGHAVGLVGLDGRLEREVCAERFALAESRAPFGRGLAAELAELGVPPQRVTEALRALVLDVLRIMVVAGGPYRFERCSHPYAGPGWVRLGDVLRPSPAATIDLATADGV